MALSAGDTSFRAGDVMRYRPGMAWVVVGSCLAVSAVSGAEPVSAPTTTVAAPVEYSLLLPGVAGHYIVATSFDMLNMVGLSSYANSPRSQSLRAAVQRDGFDAAQSLAIALEEELEAAGFATEVEPVPRAAAGKPQRLTRGDLPTDPQGRYLLDVVIDRLGLTAESNGDPWEPAFALHWRVLRPNGELVVPTHVYIHGPRLKRADERSRTRNCNLPSFKATMADTGPLWACFDQGFHDASRKLIPEIRAAQAKAIGSESLGSK